MNSTKATSIRTAQPHWIVVVGAFGLAACGDAETIAAVDTLDATVPTSDTTHNGEVEIAEDSEVVGLTETTETTAATAAPETTDSEATDDTHGADTAPVSPSTAIISEYVEGTSNNKALELYNPTDIAIDLADYELWIVSNGGPWPEQTQALAGTLPANGTFVLVHSSASPALIARADVTSAQVGLGFNGNDAIGLAKKTAGGASVLVDAVGMDGADPGAAFAAAGVADATKNHTLRRKLAFRTGDPTWQVSAGTTAADSQWEVLPEDTFDGLGLPAPDACIGAAPLDCEALGAPCGQIEDPCGFIVDCGVCPPDPCETAEPQRCEDLGAQCGELLDACGKRVTCGECNPGTICGSAQKNLCGPPFFQLADVYTGPTGSDPAGFVALDGIALFAATDSAHGRELWRSDGIPSGTTLAFDLNAGTKHANPEQLARMGDALYFAAQEGTCVKLWRSGGTAGTTAALTAGCNQIGGGGVAPYNLVPIGVTLFFTGLHEGTYDDWVLFGSNGTAAGTLELANPNGRLGPRPLQLTPHTGRLLFTITDTSIGQQELWTSDGTIGGTRIVYAHPWNTGERGGIRDLVSVGDTVYLSGYWNGNGRELLVTDLTQEGTTLLVDLWPGIYSGSVPNGSDPQHLFVLGTTIWFSAASATTNRALFSSDGSAEGTALFNESDAPIRDPANFTALGTRLLFTARTDASELWITDGTAAGTAKLATADGFQPVGIRDLTVVAAEAYFILDSAAQGRQLWRTDGTVQGTKLLAVSNPSGDGVSAILGVAGEGAMTKLFLAATDGVHGVEPWVLYPLALGEAP